MDDLFKPKLLKLRQPEAPKSFAQAIYGNDLWPSQGSPTNPKKPVSPEGFSERKQVIEHLERFVEEQVQETKNPLIRFDRGEIHLKTGPVWGKIEKASSLNDLLGTLSLEKENLDLLLSKKIPGKIQVLFATENIRPWAEVQKDLKGTFLDELLVGFPLKTAEFFERMILAMKLLPEEVILYPIEKDEVDLAHEVMRIAVFMNPAVVVTLGAKATQKILMSNDRLTMVHGQFFERKVEDRGAVQVVPLFHPSIIETNQNMKKTAWADMQKIMTHLKKLT